MKSFLSKTKHLTVNLVGEEPHTIISKDGHALEEVEDFSTTEHDFRLRKAKAWAAYHKM